MATGSRWYSPGIGSTSRHRSLHVFEFPLRYEGLGDAVIDAMPFGLPTIARAIPALPQTLNLGRCGRLGNPTYVRRFSLDIVEFGSNQEVAERLAAPQGHDSRASTRLVLFPIACDSFQMIELAGVL